MDAFRCKIGAKMPEVLFTERFLSKARPIAGEVTTRYWDTACRGLWVHVGKRTVTFYAKAGSRDYKIGHYSGWTLYEARERCQEIRRKVVAGEDPWPIRQSVQTVREAFDDFENVRLAKRRESTRFEYRRQMELYVFRKWGDKSVDRFTRADVIDLHSELSKAGKRVRANRVLATISSLYGWLQKERSYSGPNPASKVERNGEQGRETYLTPKQVVALRNALAAYSIRIKGNEVAADCLQFIMATGCRSGEAMSATWDQFDQGLTIWTKPAATTKQNKVHRVPLGPAAQGILLRRRDVRKDTQSAVFPGKYGADHIRQLRSAWASVTKAAQLESVRVHDLRHTYASLAISGGVSLKVLGGLLGHSAIATTNRYAHLYESDLRLAAERIDDLFEGNEDKNK